MTYRGETTLREFERDGDVADAITLLGLSAKWESPESTYSVRLYGQNLTNEAYYTFLNASNQLGFRFGSWNTPRQYGAELKVSF